MIGMQVIRNRMFQIIKVGIPDVRISFNRLGRLLFPAGVMTGVCFFSFKDCASLSKSI